MKFFVSIDVYVRESFVPTADDDDGFAGLWTSMKEGLVNYTVRAMAEAAVQLFGGKTKSNLVAVFDASGYSVAAGRWKASLRICFVEIAVNLNTARQAHQVVTSRLSQASARGLPDWAAALEVAAGGEQIKDTLRCILDERVLERTAFHRLVWCDTSHGEMEMPEGRPLVPHLLLHVAAEPGGHITIEPSRLGDELSDNDWVRLGSTWTCATTATEIWHDNTKPQPSAAMSQSATPNGGQPAPRAANSRGQDTWWEYRADDGRPYYYHASSGDTVWELPNQAVVTRADAPKDASNAASNQWMVFQTDTGQAYYHNAVTNSTSWHLPPDAEVITPPPHLR